MQFGKRDIDLGKLKWVVCDFDDTLFIHSDHIGIGDETYRKKVLQYLVGEDVDPWETTQDSIHMYRFLQYLKRKNMDVKFGLCSAVHLPFISEAKCVYASKKYDVTFLNICSNYNSSAYKSKAEVLQLLCDAFNLKFDEVLFIDDSYKNVEACAKLGVHALTPMEVVNFVEKSLEECIG